MYLRYSKVLYDILGFFFQTEIDSEKVVEFQLDLRQKGCVRIFVINSYANPICREGTRCRGSI